MSEKSTIIDFGSSFTKAGFSNETTPRFLEPSICGFPSARYRHALEGRACYVGNDAVRMRQALDIRSPLEHGHVVDWTLMDELWSKVLQTCYDEEAGPLLLAMPPKVSRNHKKRYVEAAFETYERSQLSMRPHALLSMFEANTKTTGVCVEIGDGVTQIVPIIDGQVVSEAVERVDIGGREVTYFLQRLLCNNGYPFTTRDDFEVVRLIKEHFAYCSIDPNEEEVKELTIQLPDGHVLRNGVVEVTIGQEQFYPPEVLFNPSINGREQPSVIESLRSSVMKCPIDSRADIATNIILNGGTGAMKGLGERLRTSFAEVYPSVGGKPIDVTVGCGMLSAYNGALKVLSDFPMMAEFVTLADYEEVGESVIERFRL